MSPCPRPTPRIAATLLALCLWLAGAAATLAQPLPIPGLPGGLGGVGSAPESGTPESPPPEDPAPGSPSPGSAVTEGGAGAVEAADSTRALIELLRDDAAREALIRQLEAAAAQSGATAPRDAPAGGGATPSPAPPAAPVLPPATFGDLAVDWTRGVLADVWVGLETLWLRVRRVPTTFELAFRAFEGDVLRAATIEAARLAVFLYGALLLLRAILGPLRRRLARAGIEAGWSRRLLLRLGASLLDLVAVPLSVIIGTIAALTVTGLIEDSPGRGITDTETLMINAFAAVEFTRVGVRFLLSPRTPELRILRLGDREVRSLWRMLQPLIFAMGFAQMLFVPVITSGISLFVGRAFSAVVGAVVVAVVILYVLSVRRQVADLLHPPDREGMFSEALEWVSRRWHWAALAYLGYLFVTVLTRPGNVLLPLLWTTAQAALVILLGTMIATALTHSSSRRLRIPGGLAQRLPLLEERLNQLVPAFLRVLRLLVVLAVLVVLLEVLGVQTLGGVIASDLAERTSRGLFSVLLVVAMLSLVWLAVTSWVDYRLNPFVGSVPTPREITLLTLLKNAVTVALIILGFIMSLAQLGMNIGPLLASAGVIGLAISFGAQRMVEDIFSGIFIQAEGAMNVGDVVDVGGTVGTVEKLTVRSVTLRDLSGVVHVIPFSSAAKISNYMRDYSYHVADIGVAYREDIAEVRDAMHEAFDRLRVDPDLGSFVLGDLEWFGLNSFGASELMMRARIKTAPGQQWGIGRAYNALVKEVFDARGIEIPFPHQTVYFGEDKTGRAPPMHLQVERAARAAVDSEPLPAGAPSRSATVAHGAPPPASDAATEQTVRGRDMPESGDR